MGRHVIKLNYDDGVKLKQPISWCGHPITHSEWLFQDAQHVALAVGGSIEPCTNCVKSIIAELEKEL